MNDHAGRRLREAVAGLAERWRRARYRRALARRPLLVPAGEVRVSYGDVQPAGTGVLARGGRVKLSHLAEAFPAAPDGFNVLYLVSSAQPPLGRELVRWARGRGARVVWNQDGVAYPAWAGPAYRRVNAAMGAMLAEADHVVYQSRFCRESADRYLGAVTVPWEVLPNCVDLDRFRPRAEPLPPEPWVLLVAGTHQQRERVLSALETVAVLRRRGRSARLVVAGLLDWPGAAADVAGTVTELALGGAVDVEPPYTQDQAPEVFRRAHVLLHPKYKDPSPTVPLEAMACGVPVVGSRSGGLPELVGEEGGLLVDVPDSWERMHVPDPGAMAEAVVAVMRDRAGWSGRARGRAERAFGKRAWVDRHAAIFRRLLDGVSP